MPQRLQLPGVDAVTFAFEPLLDDGGPAPGPCCRRRAGCDRRSRRARAPGRRRCSLTRIRLKSVVPPPMSHTSTQVADAAAAGASGRPRCRSTRSRRPAAPRAASRRARPAASAARSVSSRASSSNDAGTVRNTSWLFERQRRVVRREPRVPRAAQVPQVCGRRLDRRQLRDLRRRAPRQDRRRAVRRRAYDSHDLADDDEPRRALRPALPRQLADDVRRRLGVAQGRRRLPAGKSNSPTT